MDFITMIIPLIIPLLILFCIGCFIYNSVTERNKYLKEISEKLDKLAKERKET